MVLLSLVPRKPNNSASRYFPHSGYLGLTPVSISGTVKTRLVDDDRKFLAAKRITIAVRCYEARLFKLGNDTTTILVDSQQTLWECPGSAECTGIGNLDLPFKVVLPPTIGGQSSCHLPDYKVFWRVEAVIHHLPLTGVGSRQTKFLELNLVRHHSPSPVPLPSPICHSLRLPTATCSLTTPSHELGPGDRIPISLKLLPTHADTSVSRVQVSIERRIDFKDPNKVSAHRPTTGNSLTDSIINDPSPSPLPTPPPTANLADNSGKDAKSKGKEINLDMFAASMLKATKRTSAFFGSTPPEQPTLTENVLASKPADSTPDSQTSVFAFNVPATPTTKTPASATKVSSQVYTTLSLDKSELVVSKDGETGSFAYGADMAVTLPIPKAGHWGMGETQSTTLVDVRFLVCVKAYLVTTLASSSSQETILLPPQEITVVAVDDHRRSEIQAKIDESARARTKSSKTSSSKTKAQYTSSSRSERQRSAPPTAPSLRTLKACQRGCSESACQISDNHPPLSPPSSPSLPPSPVSHSAPELDDDQTLGTDDKTPRQSPVPATTAVREAPSAKQSRSRGMEVDADGEFYHAPSSASESTLISLHGPAQLPAIPVGLPGASSSRHSTISIPEEDISPFAWDVATPSPTASLDHSMTSSRMSLDEPELDVHAVLGGDLSFTRTLRSAPTTRQPSILKSPSSKMIKLPRGLLMTSKSKRSSPAPPNVPASRGTGAKLVAATRSMRITSSPIAFRDSALAAADEPLRPRTSSGIPVSECFVQPGPHGHPRAGSVGAVPIGSRGDGQQSFEAEPTTSPAPASPSSSRGSIRGGTGSMFAGAFTKSNPLSPLLTISPTRFSIPKRFAMRQEVQREWEDELEKIVSSSKRKTEEAAHRHQNAAKMRMSVDSAATVKPSPLSSSRRPTADTVAAATMNGMSS